jgi:hypothetical protein
VFGEAHGDDDSFRKGFGILSVGVACGTCQAAEAVAGVGDVGGVVWFGKSDRLPVVVGIFSGFAHLSIMLSSFQIFFDNIPLMGFYSLESGPNEVH